MGSQEVPFWTGDDAASNTVILPALKALSAYTRPRPPLPGRWIQAKSDGTVDCWGYNGDGQLGMGNTTDRNTPATIPALAGVTAIGVGAYHGCAVKDDGTVDCWGYNKDGQAGDGTTSANRTSPVAVVGLTGAKSVAGGSYTNCAVQASGNTQCWGSNWWGRLGDGTGTNRSTPVEVAYPNPIVR